MRAPFFIAVIAIVLLFAGWMAFGLSPKGQSFVHGNASACFARLYSRNDANYSALIFGSSRVRRSDLGPAVAKALDLDFEQVGDLSHPGVKLHFDLANASRYSIDKRVDVILFEIRPEDMATRVAIHPGRPMDRYIHGHPKDAFTSGLPFSLQRAQIKQSSDNPVHRLWLVASLVSKRLAYSAFLFMHYINDPTEFRNRLTFTDSELRDPSHRNNCYLAIWDDPSERMQLGSAKDQKGKERLVKTFSDWSPPPSDYFDDPALETERAVLLRVAELERTRQVDIVFFYLPALRAPVDQEALRQKVQDTFGVPLLVPDQDVLNQLGADSYTDVSHLNAKGRAILHDWLKEALPALLEKNGT